jgi:hypothetical protein
MLQQKPFWLHFRMKILHFRFVALFMLAIKERVEFREREEHIEKSFCLLCFQKETKRKKRNLCQ